jgi:SAM-dependent MidA family methyltransferase
VGDKLNLEEKFAKYKDITLNIVDAIKTEKYEKLNEMFEQRQLILNDINKSDYLKEELKKNYSQYDIDKLEEMLVLEIRFKKEDLLGKIKETKKRQVAINGYNNFSAKAVFLSKKF